MPPSTTSNLSQPPAENDLFRFPPEIRNIIYTLVLKHPTGLYVDQKHRRSTQTISFPRGAVSSTLLQVNTQINQEATTILYGQNTFQFAKPLFLLVFLRQIGNNRKYLRRVSIGWYVSKASITPALHLLKQAKSLEHLTIKVFPAPHSGITNCRDAWTAAWRLVLPWLRAMRKNVANRGDGMSVADVIRLTPRWYGNVVITQPLFDDYLARCNEMKADLLAAL